MNRIIINIQVMDNKLRERINYSWFETRDICKGKKLNIQQHVNITTQY